MFPKTAPVQQIQRQYRTIFNDAMKHKLPVYILNKNNPEVVIIEVHQFEEMQSKIEKYELALAQEAIVIYKKEKAAGKLKKLTSIADLLNEN